MKDANWDAVERCEFSCGEFLDRATELMSAFKYERRLYDGSRFVYKGKTKPIHLVHTDENGKFVSKVARLDYVIEFVYQEKCSTFNCTFKGWETFYGSGYPVKTRDDLRSMRIDYAYNLEHRVAEQMSLFDFGW